MSELALFGGKAAVSRVTTWPMVDESDTRAVTEVLESGKWFRYDGTKNQEFEEMFSRYVGMPYGLTTTNGTSALELPLAVMGIGAGDEVIVPAYTFYSSASAVTYVGATPVFCDVDMDTYNLDFDHLESLIHERTRAIIPVHFGGMPVDMERLMAIARAHGLFVLEDCSHAHGAEYAGKKVGSFGDAASFSFQASKNLTCGEGGIVLTRSAELYEAMYARHTCGRRLDTAWYEHWDDATNLRLTEMQAALAINQFGRLDEQSAQRRRNAQILDQAIDGIEGLCRVQHVDAKTEGRAYHLYIFRYAPGIPGVSRERFIEALEAEGVPCSGGYPMPLYKQPVYRHKAAPAGQGPYYVQCMPNVEQLCRDTVWIVQNALLGDETQGEMLAQALRKVCNHADELR